MTELIVVRNWVTKEEFRLYLKCLISGFVLGLIAWKFGLFV
jgi:hypothetical protein